MNALKKLTVRGIAGTLATALLLGACSGSPDELTLAHESTTVASTTTPARLEFAPPALPVERDPLRWPFRADSIWNLPLGRDAVRVPAGLQLPAAGFGIDEDIVILTPSARRVDVLAHDAGWDPRRERCADTTGEVLYAGVPIPDGFVTDPGFLGATPNHAAAILLADGDTIVQTQPLHRCEPNGPAVSQYRWAQDSLRDGDGIAGAHGGSQMSSLGGTIRLGEWVPGGAIRHALKINLDCARSCSYDDGEADGLPGYRWPALAADWGAADHYDGTVSALQMGSLLALPAGFAVAALRTEPARILARALVQYGAYVVDDTRYPQVAISTEWGPAGRVRDEFETVWGFPLIDGAEPGCDDDSDACAWLSDLAGVVAALEVVDDNSPANVGGAGERLAECAPPFAGRPVETPPVCR